MIWFFVKYVHGGKGGWVTTIVEKSLYATGSSVREMQNLVMKV
jgi:hypothetical protein